MSAYVDDFCELRMGGIKLFIWGNFSCHEFLKMCIGGNNCLKCLSRIILMDCGHVNTSGHGEHATFEASWLFFCCQAIASGFAQSRRSLCGRLASGSAQSRRPLCDRLYFASAEATIPPFSLWSNSFFSCGGYFVLFLKISRYYGDLTSFLIIP